MLTAICGGLRTVYNANPMEAAKIGQIIDLYRASMLIGTPTFLGGIVRATRAEELESLRLVVTGAERCPEAVYRDTAAKCPNAMILEGYGVTECSPVIALNRPENPKPFTIGKVLPSLEFRLIDAETGKVVPVPGRGVLVVRGPSVFDGYINYQGPSPFMEIEGKKWYSTGDMVDVDSEGVLSYVARIKRFIKLGGEMISLPAIEAVLEKHFPPSEETGAVIAVESTGGEHPEVVLFTTLTLERETVNNYIRQAGLSGLYNVRRIVKVESIPKLGTGKTDYRELKRVLSFES
jgi:long-chain-fatty-acid--[acyl-carrier-protein] ligase